MRISDVKILRRAAACHGVRNGHGGAVVVIPRFGGALNLKVHIHFLVMKPRGVGLDAGAAVNTPSSTGEWMCTVTE